ncbi:MAG TPA: TolC family protein, partial [Geobacteraceae bacterium]|nr:TolC family protein [Geobacteraceae bacterium]
MKRASILTSLFFILMSGQAFCLEISLEQCVTLAHKHNSGLKSFEADTIAAEEASGMAFKDFLPTLRLQGNYSIFNKSPRLIIDRNSFANGIPPLDTELPLGDQNFYSLMLTVKQPLFTGGILTNTYRKSKALHEETRLSYERRQRELTFEVKKVFYSVLNEQLTTGAMEKLLQAKKERLRVLNELLAEGYISREEVLRQETDVLFTELELMKSRNRAATAQARLKDLIHYTGSDELSLLGKPFNGILTPTLQEMRESAVAHREELQSCRSRVSMANADVSIARGGFFPQASLSGSFLQQKETNLTRPQVWLLTATIDWPIFEWGRTINDVRRATAKKQKEEYLLDEAARRVALEAEQAWRRVKEEEKAVAAHENNIKTFEYALNRDLDKFAEGKLKLSDLLETESAFIKAHNRYLAAVNTLDTELARLEAATSFSIESWIMPKPVYHVDLDVFSNRLNALVQQRKEKKNANGRKPVAKPPRNPEQPESRQTTISDSAPKYDIQAGSFKSLRNAQAVQRSICKNARAAKLRIVHVGKFYKVRITGFITPAEAEATARRLGIDN